MFNEQARLKNLQLQREQYIRSARNDVEARRAMHNQNLKTYDQEIKPLKRKQFFSNLKQGFSNFGNAVSHMGPTG